MPGRNRALQITIGRSDDPDIGTDCPHAADSGELTRLKHTQQPRLRLGRHVADLVEKQGAARRLLEPARGAPRRAGKGAALVAKQLRFDQVARDSCHVDRDKWGVRTWSQIMDRARHQFLARTGFARDEHGQIVRDDARDHAVHFLHRRRPADQRQHRLLVLLGLGWRGRCAGRAQRRQRASAYRDRTAWADNHTRRPRSHAPRSSTYCAPTARSPAG